MKIKHLSINVTNPKRSAQILAELTLGEIKPFPSANMDNAWQCIWDEAENELLEFIPSNFSIKYGEHAAIYERQKDVQNFNANHIMLEANLSIAELARIADKYALVHRFRARFGGPLYEVWLEDGLLVEFCSAEIKAFAQG